MGCSVFRMQIYLVLKLLVSEMSRIPFDQKKKYGYVNQSPSDVNGALLILG